VLNAYWNNHAMTSEAMRDGWFFTGDMARQEKDGHLIQLDREVDVIDTADGPVYSLLIEEVIQQHPAVFDACVYAHRLADGTQAPAAAVALRKDSRITATALCTALNAQLSAREQLSRLDLLDWNDFPIGITGKTLKRVFRDRSDDAAADTEDSLERLASERHQTRSIQEMCRRGRALTATVAAAADPGVARHVGK
jgi:acyl-coenzyme A synthetase/AMP-(fatty) acid ligase